jgi:hypothetical protein
MSRALLRMLCLSVLSAGSAPGAFAQPADDKTYDGTWSVRLQTPKGRERDATLVIVGYDGTWQDGRVRSGARKRGCGGKKVPVTIQASTQTLLAFTVWGDVVSAACPTLTVTLRPVSDKRLEGPADHGSHDSQSPGVRAGHSAAPGPAGSAPAGATADRVQGSAGSIRMTRH